MRTNQADAETHIYEFEGYRLDAGKRLLSREDGEHVPLMPKAFDILLYLVENSGVVVEKDELMSAIWPDTIVEENNLTQNISALRRVLGEKHRDNRFIATVPGRGYKFVAEVSAAEKEEIVPDIVAEQSELTDNATAPVAVRRENVSSRLWLYMMLAVVAVGIVVTSFSIWRSESGASDQPFSSLAVLPFKPLTADNRDEPLEMGMAETLIMKLGGDRLIVRPLSAVRRFNALEQDPLEAGRALKVDAVLDGSIQIAGDRVRVTATLFRVADGRRLWANQFDERLTDIFGVQNSISERVAASLKVTNNDKRFTDNIEAYQLYMRGNFHMNRLIRPEVEKGIDYYNQAVALDPNYALPYVGLANAYRALVLTSDAPALEMMPKSKAAAEKAVELDPQISESWTALATSNFWFDWDWRTAERNYLKAIDLDPNSPSARFFYAHLLSNIGRNDEALAEFRKARELDPVSLITSAAEGQALFFAGKEAESVAAFQRVLDMDRRFWLAHLFITRPLIRAGKFDEAIESAKAAREFSGGSAEAASTIGYVYGIAGRRDEALAVQRELLELAKERYVPPYALAAIPAALGQKSEALDYLESSYENRDALMTFLKVEPKWDSLRSEPRFQALLQRLDF